MSLPVTVKGEELFHSTVIEPYEDLFPKTIHAVVSQRGFAIRSLSDVPPSLLLLLVLSLLYLGGNSNAAAVGRDDDDANRGGVAVASTSS